MKTDDKTRLAHMLESAQEAVSFLGDKDIGYLEQNRLVSHAIVRSIEIVGEAASQVSEHYRDAHSEIPWAKIIGMRNRIVHAYFDIDFELVGSTVRSDLPMLIEQLKKLLAAYR